MIKIGITGSIASGKTTASKILSYKRGPLFSADKVVKNFYKTIHFKQLVAKKFHIVKNISLKDSISKAILKNKINIKKLEKLIHPLVRNKMRKFSTLNKNKNILFYEIPLLVENKLVKYFDIIIFIKASKKVRLKRFKSKGGETKLFNFLNKKQMIDSKKIKFCDHVIANEKNLNILKKNLSDIIKLYE